MIGLNISTKRVLAFCITIFTLGYTSAQNFSNWDKMEPEARKEMIKNMSPEERQKVFVALRDNAVVSDLKISKENEAEFKTIFNEYQDTQRDIKKKFIPREDYDKMSAEEAKSQLNKSFEVGQQLLDNRKRYAEKMQQVITPQQVLKLFNNEGRMRGKIMEKNPGPRFEGNPAPRPEGNANSGRR